MKPELKKYFEEMEYLAVCEINGEVVGLMRFIYTSAIVCGLDATGYDRRYCYHSGSEAVMALVAWKESGEAEPKDYIVRK